MFFSLVCGVCMFVCVGRRMMGEGGVLDRYYCSFRHCAKWWASREVPVLLALYHSLVDKSSILLISVQFCSEGVSPVVRKTNVCGTFHSTIIHFIHSFMINAAQCALVDKKKLIFKGGRRKKCIIMLTRPWIRACEQTPPPSSSSLLSLFLHALSPFRHASVVFVL